MLLLNIRVLRALLASHFTRKTMTKQKKNTQGTFSVLLAKSSTLLANCVKSARVTSVPRFDTFYSEALRLRKPIRKAFDTVRSTLGSHETVLLMTVGRRTNNSLKRVNVRRTVRSQGHLPGRCRRGCSRRDTDTLPVFSEAAVPAVRLALAFVRPPPDTVSLNAD